MHESEARKQKQTKATEFRKLRQKDEVNNQTFYVYVPVWMSTLSIIYDSAPAMPSRTELLPLRRLSFQDFFLFWGTLVDGSVWDEMLASTEVTDA